MTRWGGHLVGRISLVGAAGIALGVLVCPAAEAQVPRSPVEVTVPPVTLPPVTVPPALTDPLPPSLGAVLDDTAGTVDDAVGQVGGLLPGGATASPVTNPPAPPATGSTTGSGAGTDATPGPATADDGGRGDEAGGRAAGGPGEVDAGGAEGDRQSSVTRGARRSLRRLTTTGARFRSDGLPLAPADPLDDAVQSDARRFGWPMVLGLLIVAFLAFQHRADRHERKLADAPLDQGERLRFK